MEPRPKRSLLALALMTGVLASAALPSWGVSCTTQAAMSPADREAILTAGTAIAGDVATPNLEQLQFSLLPAVTGDWDGIRTVAQAAKPLLQGGTMTWGNGYLLDATDLKATGDAQFFCTNADSAVTITINLHALPPGRYALLIGDATGAPLAGQLALILGQDMTSGARWKLGGMFAREGALDGHDGISYWTKARALQAKKASWSAWFSYDMARWLLVPVDFLSSPHLEKLNREQSETGTNPANALPLTLTGPPGTAWTVTALHIDTTLHHDDLALTYIGSGVTEPVAARAEAVSVMSALLKLHPDLRENFHGLWAYADKDGRQVYAIEQAMRDIP